MYGVTLTNDGSIISSSWERQIDGMDGTAFEASVANSSAVVYHDFVDFTNPKITPLIVLPTPSMAPFPRQTLFQCHSNSTDVSKCVINRNTFLEWNCNEHLSLHKMASLDESFILFFNALTMALVQVNAAIRERSLVLLFTAIEIFAKSPCSASR